MKYLLVGSLEGQPLSWTLENGIFGVGRAKSNDIRLGDPSISREHAKLTIEETRVILEDLGSRNGILSNAALILCLLLFAYLAFVQIRSQLS